ncbi:MAG: Protein fmp52, mitochondrial [Phylliscum demangeonii]|nr:MAG: Protein fmp52, mitochondrial [Phylliscum demangeonii]
MTTAAVGSHIVATLLGLPQIAHVSALARKPLKVADPPAKLKALVDEDPSRWAAQLRAAQPTPRIFFSGLGTTTAQAGSLENQRKIDYDLNVELAEAALGAGAEVYVLISSSAISPNSRFAFLRMKVELEEAVSRLAFKHVVLLRPGLIVGSRADSRPMEAGLRALAGVMGRCGANVLKDIWAQDADVIAKAAVHAGLKRLHGQAPADKVWIVNQAEIVRLGRTEWKDVEKM